MNDPETYEKNKSHVWTDVDKSMASILTHMEFRDNELYLDFGCGAGSTGYNHLVPLAEKFNSKIHAVDISPEMIQYSRSNYPHPRVVYWVRNILEDPEPEKNEEVQLDSDQKLTSEDPALESLEFDRVISINVLQSIKDYPKALRRLYSLMRPGGQLGFASIVRGQSFKLLQTAGQHPKFSQYMKGYDQWIPDYLLTKHEFDSVEVLNDAYESYKQALVQAGFIIKHLELEIRRFPDTDMATSIDLLLSINPYVREIPSQLHEELRQLYRKKLCEIYGLHETSQQLLEQRYDVLFGVVEKPKDI